MLGKLPEGERIPYQPIPYYPYGPPPGIPTGSPPVMMMSRSNRSSSVVQSITDRNSNGTSSRPTPQVDAQGEPIEPETKFYFARPSAFPPPPQSFIQSSSASVFSDQSRANTIYVPIAAPMGYPGMYGTPMYTGQPQPMYTMSGMSGQPPVIYPSYPTAFQYVQMEGGGVGMVPVPLPGMAGHTFLVPATPSIGPRSVVNEDVPELVERGRSPSVVEERTDTPASC